MSKKIKIALLTERRADYSRFKPILNKIKKDNKLEYNLIVTGMHLLSSAGKTIDEIKRDGFKISKKINMFKVNTGDGFSMINGISNILSPLAKHLKKEKPDIILSGFDIGGNFSITIVGAHLNIPIAHIQGGERSGSIDESLRHSMSKFSNYHFVATQEAKRRLIKMGEKKDDIFVVGCPSIDALKEIKTVKLEILTKKFNFNFLQPYLLCIQHPITTENEVSKEQIKETLVALKKINLPIFFIMPNNDSGFQQIVKEIKFSKFKYTPTLDLSEYKTILKNCSMLVGNSSSGIHEAATFKKPVINIGSRQKNRFKSLNVIDAKNSSSDIYKKIKHALENKKFQKKIKKIVNPYGSGNSSSKILKILKRLNLQSNTQKINTY
ncbi:UDP-N-acetylglucosamine 2-epimerase [Candidatus Pelagibacter sp.]|uniref:UDP-N-acetylglucosamine 2-epimerase n=1 Tax=Candidatus Pelagibacter sp. TaxID=2024849 RepID=UPI003F8498D5